MMEFINTYYEALLSILFSIVLLTLAFYKKQQKAQLKKTGIRTTGIVVDYEVKIKNSGARIYYPIIKFQDTEGNYHRQEYIEGYASKLFGDKPKVEIYYDAKDIQNFIIDNNKTAISDYLFILIGIALLLFGFYFLLA